MESVGSSERLGSLLRLVSVDNPCEKEDKHRFDQAIAARRVKNVDKMRLLRGQPVMADSSGKHRIQRVLCGDEVKVPTGKLGQSGIRLTGVKIFSSMGVGSQGGSGDLEVYPNGFRYDDGCVSTPFNFGYIKKSFFRLGDEKMPPLLHFHMVERLRKGHKKVQKDIEFHLVENKPVGERNIDLLDFVKKADAQWNFPSTTSGMFDELEKECEFSGVLVSNAPATVALTLYDLIVLVEHTPPFTVVSLSDIEFVNLAHVRDGEIDMTVILQGFEEGSVLEIRSIPLTFLARIKDCLNFLEVKYCVNTKEVDWKAIVKDIAAFPWEFIIKGGWDKFELEDPETLAYYDLVKEAVDLDYVLAEMVSEQELECSSSDSSDGE